ncbi:MAG: hypothetical protein IPN93_15435 [Bacteroidetes bacterium]|nr:hypothetical protein [Bacteroidota bacterium]
MASYAIRKDVKDFMLFYPKCAEQMKDEANFEITDLFDKNKEKPIKINAYNLPIISENVNNIEANLFKKFDEIFKIQTTEK